MISIIAAVDKNRLIGSKDGMPWYLPADLKHFKKLTTGFPVIMGRKTYESIIKQLGKPLPKRTSIVMTRDKNYQVAEGCIVVNSKEAALEEAKKVSDTVWVIGGGEVFKLFMDVAECVYLTWIDHQFEGDVYFPELSADVWKLAESEAHWPDEKNEYAYEFRVYERV